MHSLFSLLGLNHAYVTNTGRLVGVVGLKEVCFFELFKPWTSLLVWLVKVFCFSMEYHYDIVFVLSLFPYVGSGICTLSLFFYLLLFFFFTLNWNISMYVSFHVSFNMEVTSGYFIRSNNHIHYLFFYWWVNQCLIVKLIHVYQNGRPFCCFCIKSLV